jgi:hypothetical protein
MAEVCRKVSDVKLGTTTAAITLTTTLASTLIVESDLSTVFAAAFAASLSNALADGFSVAAAGDGIRSMNWKNFRNIFLSELVLGILPLAVLLVFVVYQRNGKFVPGRKFKLIFIAAIVFYQIAAVFIIGLGIVDETLINNSFRALLVLGIIVTITGLTYGIDRVAAKKNL